jgi:hydroxymethylpyrimidine pyrophosphatase-like HAD family hydrolase
MAERLACVYIDLDGTLLGRDGSFLHDGEGAFSLLGARALEACARADAEVVLFSGRRRANVEAPARLLGQRAYIYEAGAALVLDGELEYLTGGLVPVNGRSIHDQIADSGAPALLLETYAGRLEYHDPWHLGREISHLFRGEVDAFEADALLAEHGHGHLRLVDNGAIQPRATGLVVERPRAYHLVPRAASKARAVARHQQARRYAPEACIAIGDSREDLGAAGAVGAFWLVANGLARDPSIAQALAGTPNARVCEESHGAGVYEAVVTELAERR